MLRAMETGIQGKVTTVVGGTCQCDTYSDPGLQSEVTHTVTGVRQGKYQV